MSTIPITIQLPPVTVQVPVPATVQGKQGIQGPPGVDATQGPPHIPVTAVSYGILDNNPAWAWQHDAATPGTSVGTSAYIDAVNGRNFSFSETGLAGERYSCHFATDLSYPCNFCYDGEFMFADPLAILMAEFDINQVLADGRTCIMDSQYNSTTGMVQFDAWKDTRIPGNPQQWGTGWHRIRHFWHRSADGNTVTFDGAEKDGVWLASGMVSTTRTKPRGWSPVGYVGINVQQEGAKASGAVSVNGRNIRVWSW